MFRFKLLKKYYVCAVMMIIIGGCSLSGCNKGNSDETVVQSSIMTQQSEISETESAVYITEQQSETVTESDADQPILENTVFHLDLLADRSLEQYDSSKVKEIILEPEGGSFVFWTEKTLTDLKLIGVEYDGDQFIEKQIYCSYDEFSQDDALLITHFYPEDTADLKLVFFDETGRSWSLYIMQDGSSTKPLMLTESDILF